MHIALLGNEEARAHLHACRTHQKSRRQAAPVGDAARHDDGEPDLGDDLRHQGHRRQDADVAARLHALDDDRIGARRLDALRELHVRHDGDGLDPCTLELFQEGHRIARTERHESRLLAADDLDNLILVRRHEHDIDAKRLVGQFTRFLNLLLHPLGRASARRNDAGAARIRYRRDKFCVRNPGHRALNDRVLDS